MSRRGWWAPLLVGTFLRVAAWAAGRWNGVWIQRDTSSYWELASDGLAGYSATAGSLFLWGLLRPPGYPAILAGLRAVNGTHAGVALLQIGFAIVTLALTYVLARRLAGEAVASVATWWLALSPLHILHSSMLLTEVPFSVFLLTAMLLVTPLPKRDALEPWRWAVSGLMLGLGTLIRPITLYMPVAVLAAMALSKLRKRLVIPGLVFVTAFAVPVVCWVARNYHVTGVAIFSTIQARNLAFYRAAGAIAAEEGIPMDAARERMIALVEARRAPGMNPAELSRIASRVAMQEIFRHPVGYAHSVARGLAYTLIGPARAHFVETFKRTPVEPLTLPLIVASSVSAILMTIASAVGAGAWARAHEWRKLLLLVVPLLYLLLIASGQEAWARFRVPLEPLLVILAAAGILYLRSRVSRRPEPGHS